MSKRCFSRRELLRQMAGSVAGLPLARRRVFSLPLESQGTGVALAPGTSEIPLSKEDDQFLEELERAIFEFFWEER
jgi:hypothetical protein